MGSIAAANATGFSPFATRNITDRVDSIAAADPLRTWVSLPRTNDVNGEWEDIHFGELRQAVDGMARWIETTIGIGSAKRETVAYLGYVGWGRGSGGQSADVFPVSTMSATRSSSWH